MTPTQIATQAAEELHEYFEHVRSDVLAVPDIDVTAALILTAAAKMVQQSGAVAELLKVESQLMNVQPHIAQLPKHQQPFIDSHVDMASEATQKALLSLRSITGKAQQGDS